MSAPPAPKGFYWRPLQAGDAALLTPHWQQLDRTQAGAPGWRSWNPALLDVHKGSFHPDLLQIAGLFAADGTLVACVAETVSLDNGQMSEINFSVLPAWRGKGFSALCLRTGLALAKARGSRSVRTECGGESTAALAALVKFGATPTRAAEGTDCWRATLPLSPAAAGTLALKRLWRRLTRPLRDR
ncbi:MAG: GNAT family N-acetyltransferase [Rhodocyclaceae bacterium]|nr:MAG: GNAT family N-acetyltransferase [Rhodocyclaceae bacterium]